ncbi:MAG TPA: 30S ribosomal protein S6 [Nitrospirae bacterium]|nr:30S ribosomal protein S6 [Nitrospirota bacterium]HDZ84680.1 30S ribosomal protein S6 [Nitrospirota bacterium]HEW81782.1 30S ribosomal protein S6 [Nitrospirota bacterium]
MEVLMNYYEKVMILDANLDDSAAEETVTKIKDMITKQGGEIFKTENWGRRKLAYELNKHQKGNYFLFYFKAPPTTILELEKLCKVIDSIIKFMVVKYVKKAQIEAILPKPKTDDKVSDTAPVQEAAAETVKKAVGEEAGSPEGK